MEELSLSGLKGQSITGALLAVLTGARVIMVASARSLDLYYNGNTRLGVG
jgi:hypothetical protein